MTQVSRPQPGLRMSYPDAGPYTCDEWAALLRTLHSGDSANAGVRTGVGNMLEVTTDGIKITIDTGAALVHGHLLINDSAVTITPTAPSVNSTYTVVAVQNNTNSAYNTNLDTPAPYASGIPAYSTRLAILRGTALVQASNYWMIPLATFSITPSGAISDVVDVREFVPRITTENIENGAVTVEKLNIVRERQFMVPIAAVRNISSPGMIEREHTGYELPNNDVVEVYADFLVPNDYISNLSVAAIVVHIEGVGEEPGSVVTKTMVSCSSQKAGDNRVFESNFIETELVGGRLVEVIAPFNLPGEPVLPRIYNDDIATICWVRRGDFLTDTCDVPFFIKAFLVTYTANS